MAKIVFLQKRVCETISTMLFSAILKRDGHHVDVFIADLEHDIVDSVLSSNPDIVAYSFYLGEERFAVQLLREIKKRNPNIITIVGGPLFLVSDKLFKDDSIDIMISGDGEYNFPEVVKRIEGQHSLAGIVGVSFKEHASPIRSDRFMVTENLNDLPMLDRDLFLSKYNILANLNARYFIRSRGCPYRCSFCCNALFSNIYKNNGGKGYRIDANYQKLFNEINYVKNKYGLEWVQFVDGAFNGSKVETKVFLKEYAKAKLPPFICSIRVDNVDEEMVSLFKEAGCDRLTIGVQSGVPKIQKIAGRLTPNEKILEVSNLIKKHKIRLAVDMIIGWPGETVEDVWESIYFIRKLNPEYINTELLILFPGTEVSRYAYEHNFIQKIPEVEDFLDDTNTQKPFVIISSFKEGDSITKSTKSRMTIENERVNLRKLFSIAVYHPKWEFLIKLLSKTKWNKIINMIFLYPLLKRSFKYDNLSLSEKFHKIQWLFRQ